MKQIISNQSEPEYGKHSGKNKNANFLLYYQCGLAFSSVVIFFTFFDVYFWESLKIIPPVTFIYLYIAAVVSLFMLARFSKIIYRIPRELSIWCIGYILISSSSLLFTQTSSQITDAGFDQLRTRILSAVFLLTMYVIFSKHQKVQNITRLAICLAVVLAIFNNVMEFIDPSIFGGLNTSGRAAGLYMNPNITGCALILGLILGIGILPQKFRITYALIVLIGVFMTFSRGAILGWFLVMGIFYNSQSISRRHSVIWILSILGISFLFGSILSSIFDLDELQRSGAITANFDNIRERLEWFQNPKSEDSADARLEVVSIAWSMFGDHPFFGNGLASTNNLNDMGISTHNMYLFYLADHGILGVFILPALVYVVNRNAKGESKSISLAFSAFILLWGCFSHNIIEERYILMSFALVAAMNRTSRPEIRMKRPQRLLAAVKVEEVEKREEAISNR
jgi:O-antigen ligase